MLAVVDSEYRADTMAALDPPTRYATLACSLQPAKAAIARALPQPVTGWQSDDKDGQAAIQGLKWDDDFFANALPAEKLGLLSAVNPEELEAVVDGLTNDDLDAVMQASGQPDLQASVLAALSTLKRADAIEKMKPEAVSAVLDGATMWEQSKILAVMDPDEQSKALTAMEPWRQEAALACRCLLLSVSLAVCCSV